MQIFRMTEHIQPLLDRIHTEGLKKAESQRDALLEQARADARRIREEAEAQAASLRKQAETDAEATRARGQTALEQAARDTLLQFRAELNRQLQVAAETAAQKTLSAPELVAGLLKDIVAKNASAGKLSIETGPELGKALETLLPALLKEAGANDGADIVLNPKASAGFKLRFADSAAVADFTDEAVATWLSATLRPELAKTLLPKSDA
jgi:V/A-type H+-transporting ATPase subunit E